MCDFVSNIDINEIYNIINKICNEKNINSYLEYYKNSLTDEQFKNILRY